MDPLHSESAAFLHERRTRLAEASEEDKDRLFPFSRAKDLPGQSLYWVPVQSFPMYSRERQWLMEFMKHLRDELKKDKMRQESFFQFKGLSRENMDLFMRRKDAYQPLQGLSLPPGGTMPPVPSDDQIRKEIEDHAYNVNVAQWQPDYCYWLRGKQDEAQRDDFFGTGHMIFLYLEADPATTPPPVFMPRILKTHPAMKDNKLEAQTQKVYAMKEKFLLQGKELFGQGIRDHIIYPGVPFVVPLLGSKDFFSASAEDRAKWFELFSGYCIESPQDKGVLLALKDEQFDERLIGILEKMKQDGLVYPA